MWWAILWIVVLIITWFIWKVRQISKTNTLEIPKLIDLKQPLSSFTATLIGVGLVAVCFALYEPKVLTPEEIQAQKIQDAESAKYYAEQAALRKPREDAIALKILTKDRILEQAKDPDSVEFKSVTGTQYYSCGQYNAKNSFGAYVGFQRFIGTPDKVYFEDRVANLSEFNNIWEKGC